MRKIVGNVKMRFICGVNGELLKGAPGNFKCGQIVSQPHHLSEFPYWELVDPLLKTKTQQPSKPADTYKDVTKIKAHTPQIEAMKDNDAPTIKRILYVIEWSVLGGAGVVLRRILENIDRSIYKTDICVMEEIGDLQGDFSSMGTVFNLNDSKDKYGDLKKIIIEGDYSVVQLYTMMEYLGLAEEIKNTKFICQLNFPLWESRQEPPYKNWFQSLIRMKPFFHSLVSDSSQQLAIFDKLHTVNGELLR